jgi:hypothetical protein
MALKINPIAIKGSWTQGWALDLHTLSSTFIGDDAYGHPHFENKRSELGELLFQFKYRSDRSGLAAICETAAEFVRQRNFPVDLIATVPNARQRWMAATGENTGGPIGRRGPFPTLPSRLRTRTWFHVENWSRVHDLSASGGSR